MPLDETALVKILTEPKNSLIKQYQKLMKIDNIELVFEEDAVKAVAQRSIQLKTGARGLRSVLENVMLDFMFDAPNDKSITKVVVDKNCIEGKDKPKVYRQAS